MKVAINLDNISRNLTEFRKIILPNVKVCAVLKANAYGHGLVKTAMRIKSQVDYFAVARVSEGLRLRKINCQTPILVLGSIYDNNLSKAIANDLTLSVSSLADVKLLIDLTKSLGQPLTIHIKCDTGMNRLGVKNLDEFDLMCKLISQNTRVRLTGIYSHFATNSDDKSFMDKQFEQFKKFISIASRYFDNLIRHICNTAGVLADDKYHLDMVRIGLGIYGYSTNNDERLYLLPAKSVSAKIVMVKNIEKGESVSYDRSFIAKEKTRIAIVDVGYGDGFTRAFALNRAVSTKFGNVAIIGKVCMDMLAIEIGNFPLKIGDDINLLGKNLKNYALLNDNLHRCDTIIYEILCIFNKTR